MTSYFRKSFPSLHIQSSKRGKVRWILSPTTMHHLRFNFKCTRLLTHTHACTVLSHVDKHCIICSKVFECFNENEKKNISKIMYSVRRLTLNYLTSFYSFFSHGFILCFVGSFYHSIIPYGIDVDKQLHFTFYILNVCLRWDKNPF